ncbi:MAG: hypothetical protein EHM71_13830 [Zetaproteobacteria bacterium]|nr:MAG: hypothetical protein EHM71_13830 [Zetaproteobacteria bacterium]
MRTTPSNRRHAWIRLAAILWLIGVTAPGGVPGAGPPDLTCSPDRTSIALGESVVMRAWVDAPPERVTRYAWDVRVGRVVGSGPEVRWDLATVRPGRYAAAVRVHGSGSVSEECLLRIIVRRDAAGRGALSPTPASPSPAPSPPGIRSRETGSAFLLSDRTEMTGYGLYSYLLFGSPPGAAVRERHLKALEAFVGLIPDIAELERYIPTRELNIAYVPLTTDPGRQATADRLFAHYDYARARSVLRLIPGGNREGPYIVSVLRPLGGTAGAAASPNPYLFQDLSTAPPHLVASWVKEFLNQAAQERFWEERSAERFALKLRVTVGVLGAALPEVKKALDTWIAWVR